ncbi:MAG: excinuclease ABC subunit UvrB [Bdellovibrionota bacterium]|nr:excinuclease ABC subunit UvrB [Bdellovibrionota bacterium]
MEKNCFKLSSEYKPCGDQPKAIKELTNFYSNGENENILLGVTGSGKTFTTAHIIQKLGKKTLILAHNKTLAAQLYAEFKSFFPENAVEYFVSYYDYYQPEAYVPGSDVYIEKDASINDEIDKLRHSTTKSLLTRNDVIVISSVSCIYGIGSPSEYDSLKATLFVGDNIDRDDFLRKLVRLQYDRNDTDFYRGCFRVRGDLVEIFPASEDKEVIRIEFFDDEVETISIVDPLRGQVLEQLKKVTIFPKSHYVVSSNKMERAIESIKVELRERLIKLGKEEKLVERQRLEQRTLLDLEMMEELGYCSGIENYSRHLTGRSQGEAPPTLIDYFGTDFLLVIDESHVTVPQVGGMFRGDRSRKENLVNYGFRLPSALDNRPLTFDEFLLKMRTVLYVSATPGDFELKRTSGEYIEQIIRPTGLLDPEIEIKDAKNQVEDLLLEAKSVIKRGERVLVTALTKRLAEELTNFYQSVGMKVRYLHSDIDTLERVEIIRDLRAGKFDILVGINLLREGLDIPEVSLVGILDADKEGFLRSERSLIQTIGRAARNDKGRVILYAYKKTKSIEKACSETKRRRDLQEKYNKSNGITPQTITKPISEGVIEAIRGSKGKKGKVEKKHLSSFDLKTLEKRISELRAMMKQASRELRFEDAAKIRDEIKSLSEARLLL